MLSSRYYGLSIQQYHFIFTIKLKFLGMSDVIILIFIFNCLFLKRPIFLDDQPQLYTRILFKIEDS